MKDVDEAIEKVLAGLRESRPPAGLEGRVLRAVRVRERTGMRRGPALWKVPAYAVLVAAVCVCLLLRMPAHVEDGLRVNAPALRAPVPPVAAVSAVKCAAAERGNRVPRSAAARRVSHEVSFPAPPLPLTQQEKLLLQVARKRVPQAVMQLSPEVQIAQTARDREEFTRFFNPQDGETNR